MCSSMKKLNHFQQKTSKLNLALFWVSVDFLLWFCQASVCFSVFVSSKQRFGVTDIKAPSACHSSHVSTDHVAAIRQISVTALFYLGDSRKIDLRVVRAHRSKDMKRRAPQRAGAGERERDRERVWALWPLFWYVFPPPLVPSYANWAQPGALFYLKSSLRSSDLPLTFLCSIFMGFSLPRLLATAILDSFSLF